MSLRCSTAPWPDRASPDCGWLDAVLGYSAEAEARLGEALPAAEAGGGLARLRVAYELGGLRALRGDWTALDQAAATGG